MKVVFSRNAERELEEIGDWIAQDNPERARSFVADIVRTCKSIGRAPRSYPLVDKQRDPTLRRRIHRNYLIFFDIGPGAVEILHILHDAQDYARILFDDDDPD